MHMRHVFVWSATAKSLWNSETATSQTCDHHNIATHYTFVGPQSYIANSVNLGLPAVPYFPGLPVFWPLFPASRLTLPQDT